MDINVAEDIIISTFNPNPQAGGWSLNRGEVGVKIHHKPSGITVQCAVDTSQHRNKALAMLDLQNKVNTWEEGGKPTVKLSGGYGGSTEASTSMAIQYPIPNPDNVDFVQIQADFANGVIICRATLTNAIAYAVALESSYKKVLGVERVASIDTTQLEG